MYIPQLIITLCFANTFLELILYREDFLAGLELINPIMGNLGYFAYSGLLIAITFVLWVKPAASYFAAAIWFLCAQWLLFPLLLGYEVFAPLILILLGLQSTKKFRKTGYELLQLQLFCIYFFAGINKLISPDWQNTSVIAKKLDLFGNPLFAYLHSSQESLLIGFLSLLPYLEMTAAFGALFKATKQPTIWALIAFHISTILFLDLTGFGLFTIACLWVLAKNQQPKSFNLLQPIQYVIR